MENDQKNMLKSVKWIMLIMILSDMQLHTAIFDDSSPIKFPQKPSARSDLPQYCEDVGRFLRTTQGGQIFLKEKYLGNVPEITYMASHDIRSEYEGWCRSRMRTASAFLEDTIGQHEAKISEKDQAHAEALRAAEVMSELALAELEQRLETEKEAMQSARALEIAESDRQHATALQTAREDADRTQEELRRHHASVLQEKQAELERALTQAEQRLETEKRAMQSARDLEIVGLRRQHVDAMEAARALSELTLEDLRSRHTGELQSSQAISASAVTAARQEEQAKAELILAEASSRSELQISALQVLTGLALHPPQRGITLEEVFNQSYRTGVYDPFFNILKAQAVDKFRVLMLRFPEGQFLHDAVIVGRPSKPKGLSREAFIEFGIEIVGSLTMQSALGGEHFKAVIVPRDNKEETRTRFTRSLRVFIVNTLGYSLNSLRTDSNDFFCDTAAAKADCGIDDELDYFKKMLSVGLK